MKSHGTDVFCDVIFCFWPGVSRFFLLLLLLLIFFFFFFFLQLSLGDEMFLVRRMKGQGAYAKVFQASTVDPMNVTILPPATEEEEEEEDDTHHMILKVQKPACAWEFYICHELRERLKTRDSSSLLLDSFMRVNRGYFFASGSVLASEYHRYGTLLDVINK